MPAFIVSNFMCGIEIFDAVHRYFDVLGAFREVNFGRYSK